MKVRQINENTDEGYRGRRDAYQRDYDSSVSGMGHRQSQAYQDDGGGNDERHDLDPSDWYIVKDGKMYKTSVYPRQEREAISRGYSRTRDEAKAKADQQGVAEGERTMSRAAKGHEKYGKAGMKALAKAGRDGAGEEKLDKIRNKHDKYDSKVDEVAGAQKCWPGHRKVGTKPGTGKNAGKRVNDCEKIGEQGVAEGLPQTLRKVVPGYAKREIDKKMDAEKFGRTDVDRDANFQRYKKIQDKIKEQGVAEMDGAPGQILAATGDKVTIDNKDGTQTIAPKASLTRDPTGKGFVLSKTPAPGGEKPDEPKPGETVFKPATTEGIEKMNEAIRMLRLAGLHKAADRLMEQQLFENPWEGKDPAKAQAWASMSPADQKWLGGADPTDQYILARAPNKGKAAAAPAAPAAPAAQTRGGLAAPAAAPNPTDARLAAGTQTANTAAPAAGQAASPAAQKVDPNQADRDDAEQGAAMRANAGGGTSAATGVGDPGEEAAAELARMKQLAGTPAAQKVDPNQADQDDAAMGAAMRANAAGGNSTSAATGVGIPGEEAAATNAQAATQAATQAANGVNAAGQNVTMPDGTNPETGEKTTTAAAPAPTQAASPAAAKTPAKSDPKVLALQQDLIRKGAKIKPDGVMGPATAAAQKQFGAARDPSAAYRGDRSDMKPAAPAAPAKQQPQNKAPAVPPAAARPGVNQPAAKPAGGQAASPAAPAPAPAADAPAPSLINRFRASRGLPTSEDVQYYEELDKMLTIAKLR